MTQRRHFVAPGSMFFCDDFLSGSLVPVVAQSKLNTVELRIIRAKICVRRLQPLQSEVQCLFPPGEYINSATTSRRDVERGCISRRQISVRNEASARSFKIGLDAAAVKTGVETDDHRIERKTVKPLRSRGYKDRDQVASVLHAVAQPSPADFPADDSAEENACHPDLGLHPGIGCFLTACPSNPGAEISRPFTRRKRLDLRVCSGHEQNQNQAGHGTSDARSVAQRPSVFQRSEKEVSGNPGG